MEASEIKEFCLLESEGERLLHRAFNKYSYSARSYHKFLKIARTLADMDQSRKIRKQDVAIVIG